MSIVLQCDNDKNPVLYMNLPTATRDCLQYKQKMQQQYKHKQEKGKKK